MINMLPDREGLEIVDGLNMMRHFGFCTVVEVNLTTKYF